MLVRRIQNTIENRLSRSPAVAILGPRQVGKTTLAKGLAKKSQEDFTYLDAENPLDVAKLTDAYTFLSRYKLVTVIIDEVQLMPSLFSIMRPLIDEHRIPGRFILLGSATPALVKGVSESLAGRIAYIELTPINICELPDKIDMERHWFTGGYPEPLLNLDPEYAKEWLNDFIKSYVERDLAYLFGIELAPSILRNFWSMLAHSSGNVWNAEVFARSLGVSAPTVLRYANFLEGGYMIRRLQPWLVNAKKRLVKSPKIYIRDTGILHRLLNISSFEHLQGHPGIGASWEGYVIEQIYQVLPDELDMFFYRTQAGAECDLVLVRGIRPLACIEIKLSNSPSVSRGFVSCVEDLQPLYKYIITPGSDSFVTSHGVSVVNLVNFISHELSKI
jgi:predicted AAA+ superfamily ATPase